MSDNPPDGLVGYRAWLAYVGETILRPLFSASDSMMMMTWLSPGVATATCLRGSCGSSPGRYCFCGLWMRSSLSDLRDYLPISGLYWLPEDSMRLVVGSVNAWGRIIEHEKGFRCQYMQVASFVDLSSAALAITQIDVTSFGEPPGSRSINGARLPTAPPDMLQALSLRYDVPVSSYRDVA